MWREHYMRSRHRDESATMARDDPIHPRTGLARRDPVGDIAIVPMRARKRTGAPSDLPRFKRPIPGQLAAPRPARPSREQHFVSPDRRLSAGRNKQVQK